ncbi:hypothetical protein [Mesobacillus zeae]|uniref:hypothetical protein n=1 Tax=Mesobacillus zeae TaxID=1917180 RepID=UPI00300B4261
MIRLIGKELTNVTEMNDEIELEFDNEIVVKITGGYCQEVFAELLRKKVTYEKFND